MDAVLDNGTLRAEFGATGAELLSARMGGVEFVWGGDPAFWARRSPVMFPICGRLPGTVYSWLGREYSLGTHGFARESRFDIVEKGSDRIRFELRDSPETRAAYPFEFALSVEYRMDGASLEAAVEVSNPGGGTLPFATGFHPGFNVPLGGDGEFRDWEVAFDAPCDPDRILFSGAGLQTGRRTAFPLVDRVSMPLSHGMFDDDAVFLAGIPPSDRAATLRSRRSSRSVRIEFPDFPYFGVWHSPRTEAPFVCLEPWAGLPSFDGVREDFASKSAMVRLPPGASQTRRMALRFAV